MWHLLPRTWRIPIAWKIAGLLSVVLIPYLLLPQQSLQTIGSLVREQQELRLQSNAGAYARLLGEGARGIEASVAGITRTRSVERFWSAWRLAVDEASAGRLQHELQQTIVESQTVSVLDYLALAGPQGDLYLAHGAAPTYDTPIPAGSLLRQLAAQDYASVQEQRPQPHWSWAIEHHPPSSPEGAGPFLMVGGPVYLPDLVESRWRYAGCIVGGRRLSAGMLGDPAQTAEGEPVQVLLAGADDNLIWSTFDPTAEPDQLLLALRDSVTLAGTTRPYRYAAKEGPELVSVIDLDALPDQGPRWTTPLSLIALQPENPSTLLLSEFRQGLQYTAMGLGLLIFLVGILVAQGLSRPLVALASAAEGYARREATTPVIPQTRDEIQQLGQSFADMVVQREEEELRRIRAEKIAAWRDIARKLAHEIKNPLQPIRLHVELLARSASRSPEKVAGQVPEAASIILQEVDRLKRLANDFAEFARMPTPMLTPTEVEPLVRHVIGLLELQFPGVQFSIAAPALLLPYAMDPEKMSQVLLNLFKNAAEAMQAAETSEPTIDCRIEETNDGGMCIAIQDNGPGIPEATLQQLFTPYFTTKETGTGLGLVLVQQIMAEHSGQVTVESVVGSGARFSLWFPASLRLTAQTAGENKPPPDRPEADSSVLEAPV